MQNREKLRHYEQENGLKPHFSPFLALNGPFLGQQNLFRRSDHYYILDTVILYHNMQNWQNLMHFE